MLSFNSVSAWIEVDGKELQQYGIEDDPEYSQVTCWIPTQVGKSFSIVFRDDMEYRENSLVSSIQLDGSYIPGKVLRPVTDPLCQSSRTVVQDGQVVSATSSRPFLFSKLELTDEDEYLNQSATRLGDIQIDIRRAQVLQRYLSQPSSHASSYAKVHERSKKAVTHCVSYGQEVQTQVQYSCVPRYLDGDIPHARFIFKYRDLGLLQANGIVPKPPPAKNIPNLAVRNVVKPEPVDEEIKIVDNKRKGVLRKRSKASHEVDEKPAKKIKREHTFTFTGEIIDLT